ncbi:protease modulator HflK [Planctomycetota bacterium]
MTPPDPLSHGHASDRAAKRVDPAGDALNDALRISFIALKFAMVVVIAMFFITGCFRVKEYEQAIVLRFGRVVWHIDKDTGERTPLHGPGLHFGWPFLIDEVVRFPVGAIIEEPIEAFWYVERAEAPGMAVPPGIKPGREGFNLTGDANILHSRWRIFYRISDPMQFCENLADPGALTTKGATGHVRSLAHSLLRNAIIRTMAQYHVDDAYRHQKERVRSQVEREVKRQLKALDVGIAVERVTLDAVVPPRQAKESFDNVIKAAQEHGEQVRNAEGEASKILSEGKTQASRINAKALAYKVRVKEQADADADYIKDLRAKYPDDPEMLNIFLEHRLIEVLEETLKEAEEVFVVQPGPEGKRQIWIYVRPDPKLKMQPDKKKDEHDHEGEHAPAPE